MNIQQQNLAAELCRLSAAPAAIGAWECHLADDSLSWTDGVYDLFGLPRGSAIQRASALDLYEEGSRSEMERLRGRMIRSGGAFSLDCRIRTADNRRRWMRLIAGVGHRHGRPWRIFGSKQDVTTEKGLWTGLAALTRRDLAVAPATRRDFEARLAHALLDRHPDRIDLALVLVALDDIHAIPEAFGRPAGDALPDRIGERLSRLFPDALASARLGPAEFALLLRMPAGQRRLAAGLDQAQQLLCRPVRHGNTVIDFTVSIGGVAIEDACRRDAATLFAEARAALHVACVAGGNALRMFDRPSTTDAGGAPN
ncbi:diguanylate cyclase [Bosea sp. (in: a-proteobacteria)]|uniref:diguanylate cyclase domain-containing protein n=1 Tax=Bosea sp. (in: a-proteobacteria) TaxID=1871050 RepID=UPI0033411EAC